MLIGRERGQIPSSIQQAQATTPNRSTHEGRSYINRLQEVVWNRTIRATQQRVLDAAQVGMITIDPHQPEVQQEPIQARPLSEIQRTPEYQAQEAARIEQQTRALNEYFLSDGYSRLYHYARSFYITLPTHVDPHDIAQEIYSRLLRRITRTPGYEIMSIDALVMECARNFRVDLYRGGVMWRGRRDELAPNLHAPAQNREFDEEDVQLGRTLAVENPILARNVLRLPDAQREIVLLKFFSGYNLSNREIGVITGISEEAVAVKLHRAIKWLRERTPAPLLDL